MCDGANVAVMLDGANQSCALLVGGLNPELCTCRTRGATNMNTLLVCVP